jgi:glyoxylase I family protein
MTEEPSLTAHFHRLEAELVSREVWRSREALKARIDPDFVEFASRGRVFDRSALVEGLVGEVPPPWGMEDFTVRALAPEVALVTYRSVIEGLAGEPPDIALRSSIWRREDGSWRITFHQWTPTG